MKKFLKIKWIGTVFGIFAGSILGYGYYYFIGCNKGTCAITSDPINSMIYGSIMGLIICWPSKKDIF